MKPITVIVASALFLLWLTCFKMISPGYVGVVVDMLGDDKGVETQELHVGMHWIAPYKSVYEFPIFEQNITWEGSDGFNFQTQEGMAIHADVGITFHLNPECVPSIFARYRRGMDEISDLFIRNVVRDAVNISASQVSVEDLYGAGKSDFIQSVQRLVESELQPLGINLSRVYIIGRFQFPANVIAALNSKIEATQRAQQRENELREAEAQAKKEIAKAEGQARCVIAEAEAQARAAYLRAESDARGNQLLGKSLSPELVQYLQIQKWDGHLPQVSGSNTPFINLK